MITPADIQKKALRQYKDFLSAVLKREHLFPLHIKGNKGKASMPLEELYPALRRLLEGAKNKKGYGYTVTLKTVSTRHAGDISMPDDIFFENVEDYLKYIAKEKEFLTFREVAMRTQKQLPQLLHWMQAHPLKVVKYLAQWANVLKVGTYFLKNPKPDIYTRTLPIDIPTTFIEEHQGILKEVLTILLPTSAIRQEAIQFEDRFYLKRVLPLIRIRALAGEVFVNLPLQDISLTVPEWNKVEITATIIFIIPDILDFLRFPQHPNSCIILGDKESLQNLSSLNLLANKQVYFWGDISRSAFYHLAELRNSIPTLISFMMDRNTYDAFKELAMPVTIDWQEIPLHLTEGEQMFLLFLKETKEELKQKHITQKIIQKMLDDL